MLAAGSARAQWEILPSGSTADLRGVQAIGNGVVWASGTEGTVLRTINDGKEWQRCATPPDAEHLDFRGVQAFDASTAIVMSSGKGALSRLYKTTDGCKTWKLIFANPDAEGFWDAIQFRFDPVSNPAPNYGAGVLIGDPVNGRFIVYDTYDKGDTWLPWASDAQLGASSTVKPAIARRGESLFAASNSAAVAPGVNGPFAFATGGKGGARLIMPEAHSPFDNGTTWKFDARALPFTASETAGAFAIAAKRYPNNPAFADLMVVGGDYSKPNEPGSAAFAPGVPRLFLGVRGIQSSRTPPTATAVRWPTTSPPRPGSRWGRTGRMFLRMMGGIGGRCGRMRRCMRPQMRISIGMRFRCRLWWGRMGGLGSCGRARCMCRCGEAASGTANR